MDNLSANLAGLAAGLRSLPTGDTEALARAGAAIEAAATALPPECRRESDALGLVLEGLQAVYLGQAADNAAAILAAAAVVDAAEASLIDPAEASLDEAVATLQATLRSPSAGAPPASLDDAAALLISLDPTDRGGLSRMRDALAGLASAATTSEAARPHVRSALEAMEGAMLDPAADLGNAVVRAIESLNLALEANALEPAAGAAGYPLPRKDVDGGTMCPAASAAGSVDGGTACPAASAAGSNGNPVVAFDRPATLPADTDADILKEYIVESLDHVGAAEGSLLALETDPTQSEPVHVVFRAFHTIKGTSGFLGLDRIQRLAHLAESQLDRVRTGQIHLTGGYADLALESCDALKFMIQGLAGLTPNDPLPISEGYDDLLVRLADPEAAGIGETAAGATAVPRLGDILVAEGKVPRDDMEAAAAVQQSDRLGETLVQSGTASAPDVAKALRLQKQISGDDKADSSIRVTTQRLDSLINMVGELVISHSMIAHDPDVADKALVRLTRNVNRTGKIVRELQDLTMSLRMVPLRATFQKMARLVRDVARKSGKNVQFTTEGEDTEIDRNMVESLGDPLVHMIRNAVDHGIESPEARLAAGKPETGTVRLKACHSAGNVVLELVDDGKGLDREKILAKAVQQNLIEPGATLAESEIFALIFRPGFSTAEKVTDVSGRGVGMDVVRKRIEAIHGRVEIASTVGRGSTFTLRLPLTMAITDAMVLRVGPQRYLLPTVSIVQSFRPEPGAVSTVIGRGEMVLLRGELIPMLRLGRLFGVEDAATDPTRGLLVVMEAAGCRAAILVDELLAQQQVVIKSLGRALGHVPGIAGGAILGDGRVGLILDAGGLLKLSRGEHPADDLLATAGTLENAEAVA